MATPIAGTGGSISAGGVAIGEVKSWELEIDRDNYDASTLGVTWRRSVVGIGSWSGKLTGFYSIADDAGQQTIQTAIINGTGNLDVLFGTETGGYNGLINPKKISVSNPVDGIVTFDVDFEGTDPLTEV